MSMHSDSSDATMNSSSLQHNPDVLEDIKQQKDILEQGIFRLVYCYIKGKGVRGKALFLKVYFIQ